MAGTTFSSADINKVATDFSNVLKDGAYVALGLGVIGFQRAQVQRVALTKQFDAQLEHLNAQLGEVTGALEEQLGALRGQLTELAKAVDDRFVPVRKEVDEQIDRLQQYLPDGARNVVQSARSASTTSEQLLRRALGLA